MDATEPRRRGGHTHSARNPRNTTETMDGYAFSSCDLARLAEPQLETDPDTALPSEERIQKNIIQVAIPRLPTRSRGGVSDCHAYFSAPPCPRRAAATRDVSARPH